MKKSLAIFLAALFLLQTLAVGTAAVTPDTTADYTGTVLAAINTNYDDLTHTFSAYTKNNGGASEKAGAHIINGRGDAEEGLLCGEDDIELEPLTPAEAAKKEAELGKNETQAKAAEYRVGDQRTIHSSYRTEFPSDNVLVECVYIGEYCTVWNEVDGGFTVEGSVKLGKDFDEIAPKEFEIFGDKRIDTDGDGKTALFVHNLDTSYGGYFSTSDLVDKLGRIGKVWFRYKGNGNACDCVHMDGAYISTLTHEFQHYLQRCWQFYGKNTITYVPNTLESYINEGFSECASYLLVGSNSRAWWFEDAVSAPDKYSLVNWSFDTVAYAQSYVFCQYLRTAYGQLPGVEKGEEIYKTIMEIRANKRVKNTLSIAADLLYPADLYPELKNTDSRCRQLLVDFWLAVLCKEDEGRHGFMGENWADPISAYLQDSLPQGESSGIRSGMAAFYPIYDTTAEGLTAGTACVTKAGKDMTFVGVSDVGYKVIYNWNNGLWDTEGCLRMENEDYALRADERYCPGKTFLGWNTDPNAVTAWYTGGSRITLSQNADTVLYAVWEDARTMTAGQTVTLDRTNREYCLRFTPEQSGCYLLTTDILVNAKVCVDGKPIDAEWSEFTDGEDGKAGHYETCYYLTAGEPCDIYASSISYSSRSLSIDRIPTCGKLTYRANLSEYSEPVFETNGRAEYTLEDIDADIRMFALTQGLEFLGWAFRPDADEGVLQPGDLLTVDKDTVLYAVWQPITTIPGEGLVSLEYKLNQSRRLFKVIPESDGDYLVTTGLIYADASEPDYSIIRTTVFDESGKKLYESSRDYEKEGFALRKGKTYYFERDVNSFKNGGFTVTASFKMLSKNSPARLMLAVDEHYYDYGYGPVPEQTEYLIMNDRFVYTVPRLNPVNFKDTTLKFVGWRDDSTGEVYHAGDKIELISDMRLSPIWEQPQKKNNVIQFFITAIRMIRYFLQRNIITLDHRNYTEAYPKDFWTNI